MNPSRTLSGGEVQRINLTTALGTSLVNTLFVLDEPSIGLHQRAAQSAPRLRVLATLREDFTTRVAELGELGRSAINKTQKSTLQRSTSRLATRDDHLQ